MDSVLVSRNRFFTLVLRFFAMISFLGWFSRCRYDQPTPTLKGISPEVYHNFRAIQEIFLKDCPIPDFDLGLALDRYIYGHPTPIETESIVLFLAGVPSSILAALALDFSFTPLASLAPADRERRLLSWKTSKLGLKRGVFVILRQISFYLLSSDLRFQQYTGYAR